MDAIEDAWRRASDRCLVCHELPTRTVHVVWNNCYLAFEKEAVCATAGGYVFDDDLARLEVKASMMYDDRQMPAGRFNMLLDVWDAARAAWRLGLCVLSEVNTWHFPGRYDEDHWHDVVEGTVRLAMQQEQRRVRDHAARWLARALRPGRGALWLNRERCRRLLRRCLRGWMEVAMRPVVGRLYLLYKRRFESGGTDLRSYAEM